MGLPVLYGTSVKLVSFVFFFFLHLKCSKISVSPTPGWLIHFSFALQVVVLGSSPTHIIREFALGSATVLYCTVLARAWVDPWPSGHRGGGCRRVTQVITLNSNPYRTPLQTTGITPIRPPPQPIVVAGLPTRHPDSSDYAGGTTGTRAREWDWVYCQRQVSVSDIISV